MVKKVSAQEMKRAYLCTAIDKNSDYETFFSTRPADHALGGFSLRSNPSAAR